MTNNRKAIIGHPEQSEGSLTCGRDSENRKAIIGHPACPPKPWRRRKLEQVDAAEHSQRAYGLLMVSMTSLLWGGLPILLKVAVNNFSPTLVAWARFPIAFLLLFIILQCQGRKPLRFVCRPPLLALVAGLMLSWNYYGVLRGVALSGPSHLGVLIQSAPLMLALIGIFVFRETFSVLQFIGLIIAVSGFVIFNVDLHGQALYGEQLSLANTFILLAALSWAIYSALQKKLSKSMDVQLVNVVVFGISTLLFVGLVDWAECLSLTWGSGLLLFSLGLITLLGYVSLAEAIKSIPVSQVSMIIALNPLVTLCAMHVLAQMQVSWVAAEPVSWWGYLGAGAGVVGVTLVVSRHSSSLDSPIPNACCE